MKSETKTDLISKFIKENAFVKSVVIQSRNRLSFYPDMAPEKKNFFRQIIDDCVAQHPDNADWLLMTNDVYLCLYKRKQDVYICESLTSVSVSQVKLEFGNLIEEQRKKGMFSKIVTSFFDR